MIYLVLDTEHSYGVMNPWEKGFYLSCVPIQIYEDFQFKSEVTEWFDHRDTDVANESFYEKVQRIQKLVDQSHIVIGHFLKHDLNILRHYGVNFEGKKLYCTMVGEYLLQGHNSEVGYSMEAMSEQYGIEGKIMEVPTMWYSGVDTYDIPKDLLQRYAQQDVTNTWLFYRMQLERIEGSGLENIVELQNELIFSLSDMELNGFKFDKERAMQIYKVFSNRYTELETQIKIIIGEPRLNLSSSKQLAAALFGGVAKVKWTNWVMKPLKSKPETKYYEKEFTEEVTLPSVWEGKPEFETDAEDGNYSTAKNILIQLPTKTDKQKMLKPMLMELSQVDKVKETILGKKKDAGLFNKVRADTYIHPHFNQCVTKTGRLSSSDPNGQNLPRDGTSPIKECIVPRMDYIFQWDLSQIEWRAAAWLSQDPEMIREINAGVDQHSAACVDIMKLELTKENRNFAKVFNFRMIYGGSAYGFHRDPRMPSFSLKKWDSIVNGFNEKYSGLIEWQNRNIREASRSGTIVIQTGRRFVFRKIFLKDGSKGYNERQFKNYPVQGIAGGDILPLAVCLLRRALCRDAKHSKLILTVHDSVVFDSPQSELLYLFKLCTAVSKQLDSYVSSYYGIRWNVVLAGECECGRNYGNMVKCTEQTIKEGAWLR